jgi:hypothetical protein
MLPKYFGMQPRLIAGVADHAGLTGRQSTTVGLTFQDFIAAMASGQTPQLGKI